MQFKLILICFVCLLFGENSNEETITWKVSKKLTWANFKAKPNANSSAVALTASGITFGYSLKTSGDRILDYTTSVETHFYPNKSWYKKEKADDYILAHEQLHFDITELYVRKFKQQLTKLRLNQNIKAQLKQIHNVINKTLNEAQTQYDLETNHSINIETQKQWQIFVVEELKKLETYK